MFEILAVLYRKELEMLKGLALAMNKTSNSYII